MNTPDAQWRQAHALLAASRFEDARPLLRQAAASGHVEALHDLGRLLLFYSSDDAQRHEGLACLRQAETAGHAAAPYLLACLSLGDVLEPFSANDCNRRLHAAALGRHPEALRAFWLHWRRHGDPGQKKLGMLCLEHAALHGDIVSLALLCDRLAEGEPLWSADRQRASAILSLGAYAGVPAALALAPAQLPAGGALPPPPALPLPFPAADFFLSTDAGAHELCASPLVRVSDRLFSAEECAFVIHSGAPYVQPSITVGPDGQRVQVPLRTSHDMEFDATLEDFSLRLLQRRMAETAGLPLSHGEWLTLLRYGVGQEYRPHRDYLPPSHVVPVEQGGSGQRQATVIAYLNHVPEGGHTLFPELGIDIEPRPGSALTFHNLDANGQPDPRTLHAGQPVRGTGVKWICTLWMRQGRLRPL